jgi:phosphoglycolate phosphatase-like HAD superfamily hydrolase
MNKFLHDIDHVCFDLDGTLVDSNITIYKTTVKTLEILKIRGSFSFEEFNKMIGCHFLDIFNELKIPVPDIEHFINIYKTFYFEFMYDSELYPGVIEVLNYLHKNNIKISLLTTKGQDQADRIIDYFNLKKYFSRVMGRKIGTPIKPLPDPLIMICSELNCDLQKSLIIGDTELDVRCGKSANAKTCGVSYGYRNRELLELEKPDYIIDNILELID